MGGAQSGQSWSTVNTKNSGGAWGGGDIPGGYTGNSNTLNCQNACAARSDCYTAAYTAQGNGCYLKGKLDSSNWSTAYAGQDWTFMAKPGSNLPSIPSPAAQSWSTVNTKNSGGAWGGDDIPGGSTGNSNILKCQSACAARSDCYTAAYTAQGGQGVCYLKGKLDSSNWSPAYAGQDWTFMAKPGSNLPSIPSPAAPQVPVNGYQLQQSTDHPNSAVVGNTTSYDPNVCAQACNANPQCTGFIQSTDQPYCWLTSSMTGAQPSLVRNTYTIQGTNPALAAQQAAAQQAAAAQAAQQAAAAQLAAQQAQQAAAQQAAAARDAQAAAAAAAAKQAADKAAADAAQQAAAAQAAQQAAAAQAAAAQAAAAQAAQQAAAAQAAAAKAPAPMAFAPAPMSFAPAPMSSAPAPMGSAAALAHSPVHTAPKYERVTPKQTEHCLETLRKCVAAAPDSGSPAPAPSPSSGTSHYQAYGGAPFGEPASTGSNIMKIFLAFLVIMFAMLMAAKQ